MLIEWKDQISSSSQLTAIDRAPMFGDGFFTTGVIQSGKLQLVDYHLRRIKHSAERLLFKNIDLELVAGLIKSACKKQPNAIIRLNFSRQQVQRGYAINPESKVKVTIFLYSQTAMADKFCALVDSNIPVSVNPRLAGLKHLNRLDSVLAASQLTETNSEALMYLGDLLVCGSKSNVFLYIDDIWQTPQLTQAGVEGVMRQSVLDALDKNSLPYKIADIERMQLAHVKAAFITNCVIGIQVVESINNVSIDTEITHKLKRQLLT